MQSSYNKEVNNKLDVVAHNIRSAHNIGSIMRVCEGLGVNRLWLSGYSPYPLIKNDPRLPYVSERATKQINKTALGAQNSLNWHYENSIDQILNKLAKEEYQLCALEQSSNSIDMRDFKPTAKTAIILGNEVDGIDQSTLNRVQFVLEIPMRGNKESFNVATAAAMAIYKLML